MTSTRAGPADGRSWSRAATKPQQVNLGLVVYTNNTTGMRKMHKQVDYEKNMIGSNLLQHAFIPSDDSKSLTLDL